MSKCKGSQNDHRLIRLLEMAGYNCTTAAASPGALDIVGSSSTDPIAACWCTDSATASPCPTSRKSRRGMRSG
jgi:hypothetical protein